MYPSLPLLLEIGVEELPASFVEEALAALPALVKKSLEVRRIHHGTIHVFGTPRRLALIVKEVATNQQDIDEEVIGPPATIAYQNGSPTRAAEAFAAKLAIPVASLKISEKTNPQGKTERYVVGHRVQKGQETCLLLQEALTEICTRIPFRKSMRWNAEDIFFGRPVRWLLVRFGKKAIDFQFAGVRSGFFSQGHRFLAPFRIEIKSAETYLDQMREVHVLADPDERRKRIMEQVAIAAAKVGGTPDPDPYLVHENMSLVEEPHVFTGSFDPSFLKLPAVVIRAVARSHQKYFCVQRSETELLPHYIAVVNTANHLDNVHKGNDRVMRALLEDALFFFAEDQKIPLEKRVEKLSHLIFHAHLGTVGEKVSRIENLAAAIASRLGISNELLPLVHRAAHLCKVDLTTLMVGEFPELQGHMGHAYALKTKEHPLVAQAIRDHYRPVHATDQIPQDDTAAILALADRLDTLTGCFAIGLMPTGTADPFALRRTCIAILRILMEKGETQTAYAQLCLRDWIGYAYDQLTGTKLRLSREETIQRVITFALERLHGLLNTPSSHASVVDTVLAGHHFIHGHQASPADFPAYALMKVKQLQQAYTTQATWLDKARLVAKRLNGISKEATPVLHPADLFPAPSSQAIVSLINRLDQVTSRLETPLEVQQAMIFIETLSLQLKEVFVHTLIQDPADPFTSKRLEVLSYGAQCMARLGNFSQLVLPTSASSSDE
ncbi:glycine--tRNA ligase subunit beta [Pajaroellobacter abortibovis]|uniref:Glycine--tRNA ligase beta subunit n=1 Tax=Pajaroellobacter abortibovis TaxID=1882918 RepID=A0A1L6MWC2_9BACT|nr:glycine--tRNA ligase subunit beta [Pajaroellobacter abortibovis]APR99853.1 glycine--tRNA ligase subunit beta [Pajaroellobacter abortibovis]